MVFRVPYKHMINKKFSFFSLLTAIAIIASITCTSLSLDSRLILIDSKVSEVSSKKGKKICRYCVRQKFWLRALTKIFCRTSVAYILLFGINIANTSDKLEIAIVVGIAGLTTAQYAISLITWKPGNCLYSKSIQNISVCLQKIISCLWLLCIIKASGGQNLSIGNQEYLVAIVGATSITDANIRITLQTEYVKVEKVGDVFRITINGIVWAEIHKDQLFEIRSICVQLHQAKKPNGEALLMLKEIAQAFDLGSLKKIFHWESRVKKQGSFLALDFEKKHNAIINELKQESQVLSPQTLQRVIELHKENPFLTYLETREILISEGILAKMGEVSMRNALERISFHAVRDSLKKKLQKGQMSYKETYLLELLKSLLKHIEKGENIPMAQLINVCNVVSACNNQMDIPDCPSKIKFSGLSEYLFKAESLDSASVSKPKLPTLLEETMSNTMLFPSTLVVDEKNSIVSDLLSFPPQETSPSQETSRIGRLMLNLHLYVKLRGSFRRVADLMGISPSTAYEWVKAFGVLSLELLSFLGVIRFSGTLCIDDKWIKIAEIKRKSKGKKKFGYAFIALDPVTLDVLHVQVFEQNGADIFKLFLLELQMKGIYPRRIITDLAIGYSQAIVDVFGKKVLHHHCFFHFKQNLHTHLDKTFGFDKYLSHKPRRLHLKKQLQDIIYNVVDPSSRKTCRKNYQNLSTVKTAYLSVWPQSKAVFDFLDRHFEKILNARENHKVVLTNNPAELFFRNFAQHYKTMAGFETVESARNYLRVFQLVYRFSNLDDEIDDLTRRGTCPLSLAGYQNIESMPFYRYLNQPLLKNFTPSIALN